MKKLLALLLLSPLASSEITNLRCDYYSTFYPAEIRTEDTAGNIAITIDTEKKTATTKDGTYNYKEVGNEVRWELYFVIEQGEEIAIAQKYRLNRVSAELEEEFLTLVFDNGFTGSTEDLIKQIDLSKYKLGLVHSAKCKKVESIF